MTFVFSLFLEKEKRECQAIVDELRDTLDVRNATIESLQKVLGETEMLCSSLKVPLPSHPSRTLALAVAQALLVLARFSPGCDNADAWLCAGGNLGLEEPPAQPGECWLSPAAGAAVLTVTAQVSAGTVWELAPAPCWGSAGSLR